MSFFWIYLRAPNDVSIRPLKREHTFVKYWKISYSEPALFLYENLLISIFKPFFLIPSILLYVGLQAVTQGKWHWSCTRTCRPRRRWVQERWLDPFGRRRRQEQLQLAVRCLPLPSLQLCWLVAWCRLAINVPFLSLFWFALASI
jgi:hypothetical protein